MAHTYNAVSYVSGQQYGHHKMATSEHTHQLPPLGAGYLFTPPEHIHDDFSKPADEPQSVQFGAKLAPIRTLSPPASPVSSRLPSLSTATSYSQNDEPLYPSSQVVSTSDVPLFEPARQTSPAPSRERASPPPLSHPILPPLSLGSIIGPSVYIERSPQGAFAYYKARMAEIDRYRAQLPHPTRSTAVNRDPFTNQQVRALGQSLGKPSGVTKNKAAPKSSIKPKTPKTAKAMASIVAPIAATRRTTKQSTPKSTRHVSVDTQSASGDKVSKHKRAAPTKKVEGKEDDSNWRELPDYSPPISSITAGSHTLKALWRNSALDISDDPDFEHLDPLEVGVAEELRLHPVQYLANKRRFFAARVVAMREHKHFTKTAAQQACNIDVNKASRLWEAYDRVGWLDEVWFEKYV